MDLRKELIEEEEIKPEITTLVARATIDDMAQIRELGRRYGTPYFAEVVRLAVRDALAHFECQESQSKR